MTEQNTSTHDAGEQRQDYGVALNQTALLVLGLTAALTVVVIAHLCQTHDQMLLPHRLDHWKQTNGQYIDCRFYASPEERLLHGIIPTADYSRGGVYFLGGSQLQRSVMLWNCSPAEQSLIHNYCLAASPYTREFQFLKFLVEQKNILQAGGEKNLVVFDLCFTASAHFPTPMSDQLAGVWSNYFTKHDMYSYEPAAGIRQTDMPDLWRSLRFEGIQTSAFCVWAMKAVQGKDFDYLLEPTKPSAAYTKFWLDYLGSNWKSGMDIELEQFASMIDYLQKRHVNIAVVYLPLGSWFEGFEPVVRYRAKVFDMLAARSIPVTDMNHKLADDGFADSIHPSYKGNQITSPVLLEIARQHLRTAGIEHSGK